MKIGIIGTGNIAEAMIKIFLKNRVVTGSDVMVFDLNHDKLNYWAGTYDVVPCQDIEQVVVNCQILFLAVGGESLTKLISSMDILLRTHRPLVVSLARGKTLVEIEDMMEFIPPMARILTNLNIETGAGITAYCFNELVTDELKGTLLEMFSITGLLVEIDERFFDPFSAISALSSVYACSLVEILTNCGVFDGLRRDIATKTALQCISGTTKQILEQGMDVSQYIAKICPPQSMVTEAYLELKANGFDKAVINGYKVTERNHN